MTDTAEQFALPVTLDSTYTVRTEYGYDEETGHHEEEVRMSLGETITEQTSQLLAAKIAVSGRIGASYLGKSVDLDQIIRERIEEAITARVEKVVNERVEIGIINMAQAIVTKKAKAKNRNAYSDSEKAEPRTVTDLEEAVDILVEEWADTNVEEKSSNSWGSRNYDTRLNIAIRQTFDPRAEKATKEYLKGLDKELTSAHKKAFTTAVQEIREHAIQAVKDSTSSVSIYLKDSK